MSYSIFLTDAGHAIHGSRATGRLGSPASHGCIRLPLMNARISFNLVQTERPASTRIEITGFDPIGIAVDSGSGTQLVYNRLTSFEPLKDGIMAGVPPARRMELRKQP